MPNLPNLPSRLTPTGTSVSAVDLSIVIVTHRTRDLARDCLHSLFVEGGLDDLSAAPQVILVDNASEDGTVEMVAAEFPAVCLIALSENAGFAAANNLGIASATGQNVLLLNPDTIVPPKSLARCLSFLESCDEMTAGMTCRVQSVDGSLQWTCARRLLTPWSECCRALLLDRIFSKSRLFNSEPMVGWDRSDTRPVEVILGAFMLLRRSALEQIGGLDEGFFLMYEDIDWCKRAHDAGWSLRFWPGTYITHLGGESWKQLPVVTYANSHLSLLTYLRKHYPRSVGLVHAVSKIGMEIKIALLHLNLLRKRGDSYTQSHLAMARAARETLRTGRPLDYGGWSKTIAAAAPGPLEGA